MSATDDSSAEWATTTAAAPDFELTFAYDDPETQSLVTVFPPDGDDITTEWLSVDAEHAVPIDEVR